ncbi:hypothetical protein ACVIW0_001554 [Bradyrhizobium sp. USDA 4454]
MAVASRKLIISLNFMSYRREAGKSQFCRTEPQYAAARWSLFRSVKHDRIVELGNYLTHDFDRLIRDGADDLTACKFFGCWISVLRRPATPAQWSNVGGGTGPALRVAIQTIVRVGQKTDTA